ncbi:predicted protein [Uncinocarpus reesii 1704]|uniref:Centrosomin N-terminal motif 1 domain-containing protein n=1 Tax=Uncinocarpus reesii (strain UAMH 1704) TaxID=336963 RepID=C4JS70_UNCRE|nr:uncharacterized protein UREG_05309 [Uncinocarpus reesii 1704]EEP80467.1 predicted protein [Uncinocarpus reesii 1704]
MDSSTQRRLSGINASSPSAHFTTVTDRRHELGRPVTPEAVAQRKSRRSSHRLSKGSVTTVHAGIIQSTSTVPVPNRLTGWQDSRNMSSHRSAAHQPHTPKRSVSTPHHVHPNSTLLHDLIKEQRAVRVSRPPGTSKLVPDGRSSPAPDTVESAPASEKNRKLLNAVSAGLKDPKELGLREMDQYVSRINKEIFDLKLEIVHRIEHINSLKQKVERMGELEVRVKELEAVEVELQDANQGLQKELEKRNRGLYEAVGLICDLESKIEAMESAQHGGPDCNPDAVLSTETLQINQTPKVIPIIDVPDRSSSRKGTTSAMARRSRVLSVRHSRRQPSFLQDESENTSALRSLYVEDRNNSRPFSIFSGRESEELDSPRLSALSECSDLDLLSSPLKLDGPSGNIISHTGSIKSSDRETETTGFTDDISSRFSRIEEWIPADGPLPDTRDSTPTNHESPAPLRISRKQPILGAAFETKRNLKGSKSRSTQNNAAFGARLPPTPDTMSTTFIDPRSRSNPSIIEERSLYGRGQIFSSVTSDESVGRPGSSVNMASRPSTADTALFNSIEWNHPNVGRHGKAQLNGVFPPPGNIRQSSEPPHAHSSGLDGTRRGTNDRGSTWDCANESEFSSRPQYSHSIRSRLSDSALSDPSRSRAATNSDILSPEDWLEAALPVSRHVISRRSARAGMDNGVETSGMYEPGNQLDADISIPATRARHKRMSPVSPKTHMRRGFTFRFFNRPKNNNPMASEPVDEEPVSSPRSPHDKRPSTARRRSMRLESSPTTTPRNPNGYRPLSRSSVGPDETSRPRTSNSLENLRHFRRGSSGLWGWLKGSKNSTVPGSPGRPSSQPPERPSSACGFVGRPDSRADSYTGGRSSRDGPNAHQRRARHPLAAELTKS